LELAGYVVGGVYQVSGNEYVETGDDGERDGVVDEKLDEHHGFGVHGSEFVRERVTGLEQGDVVGPELADVRVPGSGYGARHGHCPDGRGNGHRESGGESADDGRVQFAHRVHDGEVPVGAERGQREHRHANRHVFGRFRHFAGDHAVRPRRKLSSKSNTKTRIESIPPALAYRSRSLYGGGGGA